MLYCLFFYLQSFLDSGDLLVYKMFFYDSTSAEINKEDIETYLPIRFQRVSHGYITRPFTGTDGHDEDVEVLLLFLKYLFFFEESWKRESSAVRYWM